MPDTKPELEAVMQEAQRERAKLAADRAVILESQLEASILAGPLTINTKGTVNQVAVLLRRTAEELIDAKIVEAPRPGASPVSLVSLERPKDKQDAEVREAVLAAAGSR